MITARTAAQASLLAASLAGNVFLFARQTASGRPARFEAVELAGKDLDDVILDDSGATRKLNDGDAVRCTAGGYLDGVYRSDKEWCAGSDGVTTVRDARGEETITIEGGRALSVKRAR